MAYSWVFDNIFQGGPCLIEPALLRLKLQKPLVSFCMMFIES